MGWAEPAGSEMFKRSSRLIWLAISGLLLGLAVSAEILRGEPESNPAASASSGKKAAAPLEPLFVDWPKPDVALVFSGEQNGYIEPCGCAGLENQKGGLKRRYTFIKQLRDKGWNVVPMDLGGQESRTGVQAQIKVDVTYRALIKMGYAAVGFGPGDLKIDLLQLAINLDPKTDPFVSCNVAIGDFNNGMVQLYKVVDVGGMRIGITSILGSKEIDGRKSAGDIKLLEPNQAIPPIIGELSFNKKCDHLVLLSNANPDETKALAVRFPDFDWVMTARGAEEPPKEPGTIKGTNAHLVEVGQKAEYVVVVGLYKNGKTSFRYQRVPLDHRFADAPEMQAMQVEYQEQLKTLGLKGLGLKPVPHPSGRKFVGSKTCETCHTKAAAVFDKTPHAKATDTLVKLTPPRHFDPECLSCHTTGWDAQRFFPYESGYLGLTETPEMVGNGCENCHGPGSQHADAENGNIAATDAQKESYRADMRLKIAPNEGNKPGQAIKDGSVVDMCMGCHDLPNSPEFDFQKYWPKVKHVGKD